MKIYHCFRHLTIICKLSPHYSHQEILKESKTHSENV